MDVIKDLATVISMIVSTITIAGIYYSDNGEVEKRKKIFLKNIALIIVFTILLWIFSIYLFIKNIFSNRFIDSFVIG